MTAESIFDESIINTSFEEDDENLTRKRSKQEFEIDTHEAEYTEVKRMSMKKKILIVALIATSLCTTAWLVALKVGAVSMPGEKKSKSAQQVLMGSAAPATQHSTTAALPASLLPTDVVSQQAPQFLQPAAQETPAVLPNQEVNASEAAQPNIPTVYSAPAVASTATTHSLAVQAPINVDKQQQPTAERHATTSTNAPSVATTTAATQPARVIAPQPVEPKLAEVKREPVVAPNKTTPIKPIHKPSYTKPKIKMVSNSNLPAQATDENETGVLKPLNMVPADRIGLRSLTSNGLVIQKNGATMRFGVGDSLPNGEVIKRIDDQSLTIVTDKQVMRIVN